MKKQIRAFAVCVMFGMGIAVAAPFAQDPQSAPTEHQNQHQADPQHQVQVMTKRLNLNADQQSQLLPILTERQQNVQAIRADNTLSQKDRREKIRSVMQDSRNKIESVLTDAQKQQWQQMRQHNREHNGANSANQS